MFVFGRGRPGTNRASGHSQFFLALSAHIVCPVFFIHKNQRPFPNFLQPFPHSKRLNNGHSLMETHFFI